MLEDDLAQGKKVGNRAGKKLVCLQLFAKLRYVLVSDGMDNDPYFNKTRQKSPDEIDRR